MKERIIVENVSKKFKIGFKKNQSALSRIVYLFSGREPKKTIESLKDISFKIKSGEIVGIIGKNGSGKSTLLRCLAGIYEYRGKIRTTGKIVSLINLNIGMQHRLTMENNIFLCCSLFGLSNREIRQKFSSIVEFSELKEFVSTKLYQFSNGMLQRLAFSIAIHCKPDILLLDEVFEIGDERFKMKSAEKIKEMVKKGACVILVSHDMNLIEKYCNRAVLMERGKIIYFGNAQEAICKYRNLDDFFADSQMLKASKF